MDVNPMRTIVDYLLRLPIEDRAMYFLIEAVPLPKDGPHLMRLALLRKIHREIKKGLVSEEILDCLEAIEQSDFQNGIPILDVMKNTYFAVAVHCTAANCFQGDVIDNEKYTSNVTRIWKGRINDMENAQGEVALFTDNLKVMCKMILNSLSNENVRDDIIRGRDTLRVALNLLKTFHEKAVKQMGPTSREMFAAMTDGTLRKGPSPLVACQVGKGKRTIDDVIFDDSM